MFMFLFIFLFFREAIKAQIHLKEVQLQKEKEMILARYGRNQLTSGNF